MKDNLLDVGDVLYAYGKWSDSNHVTEKIKIVKVTKTRAYYDNERLLYIDREVSKCYSDSKYYVNQRHDKWSSTIYYVETEDLKQRYQYYRDWYIVKNCEYSKLSVATIKEIAKLIKSDVEQRSVKSEKENR